MEIAPRVIRPLESFYGNVNQVNIQYYTSVSFQWTLDTQITLLLFYES